MIFGTFNYDRILFTALILALYWKSFRVAFSCFIHQLEFVDVTTRSVPLVMCRAESNERSSLRVYVDIKSKCSLLRSTAYDLTETSVFAIVLLRCPSFSFFKKKTFHL